MYWRETPVPQWHHRGAGPAGGAGGGGGGGGGGVRDWLGGGAQLESEAAQPNIPRPWGAGHQAGLQSGLQDCPGTFQEVKWEGGTRAGLGPGTRKLEIKHQKHSQIGRHRRFSWKMFVCDWTVTITEFSPELSPEWQFSLIIIVIVLTYGLMSDI